MACKKGGKKKNGPALLLLICLLIMAFAPAMAQAADWGEIIPDTVYIGIANFPWGAETCGAGTLEWQLLDLNPKTSLAADFHFLKGDSAGGGTFNGKAAAGLSIDFKDLVKGGKAGLGYAFDAKESGWSEKNIIVVLAYRAFGAPTTTALIASDNPRALDVGFMDGYFGLKYTVAYK